MVLNIRPIVFLCFSVLENQFGVLISIEYDGAPLCANRVAALSVEQVRTALAPVQRTGADMTYADM
jgi:hypothetical protein